MGSEQISEISSVLDKLYAGVDAGQDLCASFEADSGDQWVQLMQNVLNIYWPLGEAQAAELVNRLQDKLPHCQFLDAEEESYATYEVKRLDARVMAGVIDWIFVDVLDTPDDYGLDNDIFEM